MRWGPRLAEGGQNFQNMPSFLRHLQKNPTENEKRFFSIASRRLAESEDGLDSSLAPSPDELWPKECEPIYGLSRSLNLHEFKQTHDAEMFSSKCETFVLQVRDT